MIAFEQLFYAVLFLKQFAISQIHGNKAFGDVPFLNADRVELAVFPVTGAFVHEKLHVWAELSFDFEVQRVYLFYLGDVFLVYEALPAGDDATIDKPVRRFDDFVERR